MSPAHAQGPGEGPTTRLWARRRLLLPAAGGLRDVRPSQGGEGCGVGGVGMMLVVEFGWWDIEIEGDGWSRELLWW